MKNLNCFLNTFSLTPSRFIFQRKPEKPKVEGQKTEEANQNEPNTPEERPKLEKANLPEPNEPNTPEEKGHEIVDKETQAIRKLQFKLFKDSIEDMKRKIRDLSKNARSEEYAKVDKSVEIMSQITETLGINFKDRFLDIAEKEGLAVGGGDWDLKIDGDNIVITRTVNFISRENAKKPPLERPLTKKPPLTIKFDLTVRPDLTFSTDELWERNSPEF